MDVDSSQLAQFLSKNSIAFKQNHWLSSECFFKTGGSTSLFIEPTDIEQVCILQNWLSLNKMPYFLIGGGSNLLISDSGFNGALIRLALSDKLVFSNSSSLATSNNTISVNASYRASNFAKKLSRENYSGFEFLTTIPGSIGGAIVQNAGCYGGEIKDVLVDVQVAIKGKLETLSNSQCQFAYRSSKFKENRNTWLLGATFKLIGGDANQIAKKVAQNRQKRIDSQPKNRKSAGSIFKNPTGQKAWQLISDAGLAGKSIGGAEISPHHANFIINKGDATSQDVYHLIKMIEKTVLEKFDVQLEREVILIGDFDKVAN